jgi:hypothetical protein
MSALLLLGFAFVGGAIYTLRGPTGGQATTRVPVPTIQLLDLAFESSPIGADVYVVGSNEYLGRTPFRRKVEYRTDRTTFVVFRLAGHLEMTREVRPEWSGAVTLQLAPPPAAPPKPPTVRPPTPPPTTPPPAVTPRPLPHPSGKVDPFEKPKPKHRGKVKGKISNPEKDPFESPAGKVGKDGRKSSPFD